MPVVGKLEVAGRGLHLRVQNGALLDLAGDRVEVIDIDMVHAQVCHAQIFVVAGHLDALDMGPEIALRNAAQSLEIELIRDLSDTAVLAQPQDCDLAVVIAADEQVLIPVIGGQVGPAHAVDGTAVDLFQVSALADLEGFHAEIRDGIEETSVVGDGHIGGIGDGDGALLREGSRLHIHIVDTDADLFPAGPRVGGNVGDKFVSRHISISFQIQFLTDLSCHIARPFPRPVGPCNCTPKL